MYKKRYDSDYPGDGRNDVFEEYTDSPDTGGNFAADEDRISQRAEKFGFVQKNGSFYKDLDELQYNKPDIDEKSVKKKKSLGKRLLITLVSIVIVIAVLLGIGVLIAYKIINKLNIVPESHKYDIVDDIGDNEKGDTDYAGLSELEKRIRANIDSSTWEVMSSKDVVNVLLIGTDARGNERGRSDTIMIASVNTVSRQVVLTSILRDVYVEIPGKGYNRINAAYAYGGPPLLLDTIEANFKIKIEKYAYTNFYDYVDIVDAMGGITIMLDAGEIESVNAMSAAYAKEFNLSCPALPAGAGQKNLNGIQTLMYSRIRKADSDFARTGRQRLVLQQIFYEMKSKSFNELYDLMDVLLPKITTNMSDDEIFYLLLNSPSYLKYSLTEQHIPVSGSYEDITVRGMMVLGLDFDSNIRQLRNTIFDKTTVE